ncbi:MAG: PfkB family carbohydrate kinase [Bacteroidia bacterium]|jgi:sugar/nucleoside kinase (ribokinase family)|nr:PfkB family carbohydrate kinase [Bacteroidia bacterium]
MSLVVVGSIAFDAIETPFGKTDKILGGAAMYTSLAASYFVNPVKAISVVGYDFEHSDLDMFRRHGVELEGVQVIPDQKSFFWSGRYHHDMNTRDTLVTELNVLGTFDPVVPESYQDCEYLMLGNLSPDVQESVIRRLRQRPRLIVMDTMNFWMNVALPQLHKTLAMVDLLVINDEEARQLSGEYSLMRAAKVIMALGPRYLVIKKGEHGALLFHESQVFSAPGLPLEEVFDPTGAGDTFAGGLIGYLARTKDVSFDNIKRAVIYGSAMASFCVEKFGPERIIALSEAEIQTRVQTFVELADFQLLPFA